MQDAYFNMQRWIQAMEHCLKQLYEMEFPFDVGSGSNYLEQVEDDAYKLPSHIKSLLTSEMQVFYQQCHKLTLPTVWNGFFISSAEDIFQDREKFDSLPERIEGGEFAGDVLMFGSDGGGGKFLVQMNQPTHHILYLPDFASIETGVYHYHRKRQPVCLIARTFFEFLDMLLRDFQAFVNRSPGWCYITDFWEFRTDVFNR